MSKATSIAAPLTSTAGTRTSSRPDGQLSDDGRFRWSSGWQQWVPTGREAQRDAFPAPAESGPPLPERHSESCVCGECMTAGQHYSDYVKARGLW